MCILLYLTLKQIKQIAQGLEVLHSFDPPTVHGTLKGVRSSDSF
jgi:hypothetical protein